MANKDFKVKNKLVIAGLTNSSGVLLAEGHTVDSHTNLATQYGGTGTTTSPSSGQILYSTSGSTYAPTTLSSLVIPISYTTGEPESPVIGQIWIDSDSSSDSYNPNLIRRQAFTATAGQTQFTTTINFIEGYEQVYFNGLLLLRTADYTTSNSNTVTLGAAAAADDIIEVVTVTNLNSTNTYTQSELDSLFYTQSEIDALFESNTALAPLAISTNTNVVAKKRYFVTSAEALTLTLPSSPTLNDQIEILDASGNAATYNITIARNGKLINGNAGNLIIDNNGGWYTLLFTGNTYGWKVG